MRPPAAPRSLPHVKAWCRSAWRRLAVVTTVSLAGCAGAPPAPLPAAAVPAAYREAAAPGPQAEAPADAWWQLFGDPLLDAWVLRARRGNPGLAQAAARVARAAAVLGVQAAEARPHLDGSVATTRQMGPLVNAAGTQGNLFSAGLRLAWDADVLQRLSRRQQAAALDLRAQQALHQHARQALDADVVQTYLAWQAVQAEAQGVRAALQADQALVAMAERRQRAGLAAADQRSAALAEQWADEAEAQALARRQALLEHALLALSGGESDDSPLALDAASGADLAAAPVPVVPAGLPSHMLQRRADVAAADQAVQAARLRLGLARDAWFPSLTLTAQAGLASSELSQWLRAAARSTGLGLLMGLPLLDGGRLDAERAAAAADLDLATAAHREKVVQALREVDDQLATLRTLDLEAQARRQAADEAARDAARVHGLWQAGLRGEADALQARRQAERARRPWLQAQAARRQATAALVRALGGGWGAEGPGVVARAPSTD